MRTASPMWIVLSAAIVCLGSCARYEMTSGAPPAGTATLYVSPDGDDRWTGSRAAPNAARTDGPLATLAAAQAAARVVLSRAQPVRVVVHAGTYFLDQPLVFTQADAGTSDAPAVWEAPPGTAPVISGGRLLVGWRETTHNGLRAWQLELPEGQRTIRQLFANDRRCPRTRLPKEGFFQLIRLPDVTSETPWQEGQTRAEFRPGDLQPWHNLGDVELIGLHLWSNSRLPLAEVDTQNHVVTFTKKSCFRLTDDNMAPGVPAPGSRFWVENVFEALDTPGQWYLDTSTGVLTYLPQADETLEAVELVAARLPELVRFGEGAKHITLRGLTFAHQEWMYGPDMSGSPQADVHVPGAIAFEGAEHCRLERCTIAHVAGYGARLAANARYNALAGCDLFDLGAGGVMIWEGSEHTAVEDCVIVDGGNLFPSAVGVLVGNCPDNTVVHNEIGRFYYTGVSVGWRWGYGESKGARNCIAYNHIHTIGRGLLSDMGGIYTLGIAPGTLLSHNVIHDVSSHTYGGWGLYTDEGSSGVLLEKNLVYRTKSAGFHQHYGRENVVRNNVFVFAEEAMLMRTRVEEHLSFVFERNVVVSDNGRMVRGGGLERGAAAFINNLYFDVKGTALDFAGATFEEWRGKSFDYQSRIADPLFVDPAKDDFRLRPESPAYELGFEAVDWSTVGPRR